MPERMFAPGMVFTQVMVPVNELAAHLREYIMEWLPDGVEPVTAPDADGKPGDWIVYFPMTGASYLAWGHMLMEELHSADMGMTPEDGCEFLVCFDEYAPGAQPGSGSEAETIRVPATAMYASLYISDDGGLTWRDRPHLQLKRTRR